MQKIPNKAQGYAKNFRPEIEGLRGVAVLVVILFHANSHWLPGGFLGVDLFFVLSGYLIIGQILSQLDSGTFKYSDFYLRRVRRLAPAGIVVTIVTLLVGWIFLLPGELALLGRTAIYSGGMISNWFFFKNSGYFDQDSSANPLLHTWSLSVEEQFYFIAPLSIYLVWKFFRPYIFTIFIILGVGSLILCEIAYSTSQSGAFYLTPFRAWELLFGGCLHYKRLKIPKKFEKITVVICLIGLFTPLMLYSESTRLPGFMTLPVILSTMVLLLLGAQNSGSVTFFKKPLLGWFGKISYSLYLWHWPIFVYWKVFRIEPLQVIDQLLMIALAIGVSYLSWLYIEQPARRLSIDSFRLQLSALAMGFVLLPIAVGSIYMQGQGFPKRFSNDIDFILSASEDRDPRWKECFARKSKQIFPESGCVFGADNVEPSFAIIGDSHANMFTSVLGELLNNEDKSILELSHSICPPLYGLSFAGPEQQICSMHNKRVDAFLSEKANSIETVVFSVRHAAYINGPASEIDKAQWRNSIGDMLVDGKKILESERQSVYSNKLATKLNGLISLGYKLIIIYPAPEMKVLIPNSLARLIAAERSMDLVELDYDQFKSRNEWVYETLDSINSPNVKRVYP